MAGAGRAHFGRVGLEHCIGVGQVIFGEDLHQHGIGLIPGLTAAFDGHLDAAVGHEGPLEGLVGLQAHDLLQVLEVLADISGAVAGDGGHNMCIHVQHAALGAFFLLQLLKGCPKLVRRFGGAGEETFIAVVGGVVGLDEVADVYFFLPQGAEEAVPLVEIVHSDLLINIIGKLAASKMIGQGVLYHKMLYYASVNITT